MPDDLVGDAVMAALVLRHGETLSPGDFAAFLAAQPDLSPKAWPRYVWIADDLPSTATNKIVKRELIGAGLNVPGGTAWERASRGRDYRPLCR